MLKKISLLITAAIFAINIFSCGNYVKLKNDGETGNLTDEENGLYYIYCLGYLRAAEISAEVYARGDRGERLHAIPGIEPSEWLSENIRDMGMPFLFRERSVEEPGLEDFETSTIYVTMSGEISVEIRRITDINIIETIINDFLNAPGVPPPDFISDSLTLNFASEKYRGIYYILEYISGHEDNYYIFDRWTGRCVLSSIVF
ncbi:MAG: hypothetical protein FWH10_09505 [Oscillospiraceae bacterium]|nr:hypothetical protein [Oscillospiraceae bacterium]